MRGTLRLTAETATARLDVLDRRLGGSPAEILQIPEHAALIDACVAFAALAATHAPRCFVGLEPMVAERAKSAYDALRQALHEFVQQSRERQAIRLPDATRARPRSPPIASTLRRMIDRRELLVMYEPIVDLATGAPFGYEARVLAAATDSPAHMFQAAARHGLVGELGRVSRRLSIDRCREHALFLGLDPAELANSGVWHQDDAMFHHARGVYLEIMESTPPRDLRAINALRDQGMHLVIDDVGVGRSNLKYLADLRPEIVKLDRALIANLTPRDRMFQLVSALVVLCHDLGATVIASGIDTVRELEAVKESGADLGQGSVFGQPATRPVKVQWPRLRPFSQRPTIRRELGFQAPPSGPRDR